LALRECAGIAGACGYPLSEAFLADKSSQLSASDSTLTSSMYRDLQKQASVEVDTIIGDLIERGRERNISAPIVQAAFVSLSIYERALTVRQLRN
jgi:2-dehydropantoate 2-reductase